MCWRNPIVLNIPMDVSIYFIILVKDGQGFAPLSKVSPILLGGSVPNQYCFGFALTVVENFIYFLHYTFFNLWLLISFVLLIYFTRINIALAVFNRTQDLSLKP